MKTNKGWSKAHIWSIIVATSVILGIIGSCITIYEFPYFIRNNPVFDFTQFFTPSRLGTDRTPIQVQLTASPIPKSCDSAFSDEFNGSVQSGWSWIDPGGNATHDVTTQSSLHISTPTNNDLSPYTNYNAPRLLQPISGNFTVVLLVEFSPSYFYQGAGILIWQSNSKFIRLERSFSGINSIVFQKEDNGSFGDITPPTQHPTTAIRVELRIQRNGDVFTASWREPNQEWQIDGNANVHFDNIMVGLDLLDNGNVPQTQAYYDYFRVSSCN